MTQHKLSICLQSSAPMEDKKNASRCHRQNRDIPLVNEPFQYLNANEPSSNRDSANGTF